MLANAEPCLLERDVTMSPKVVHDPFAIHEKALRDVISEAFNGVKPSLAKRECLLKRSSASLEVARHRNGSIAQWPCRPGERVFAHQPARGNGLVICTINEANRVVTSFTMING
jgi:hypothetical protein